MSFGGIKLSGPLTTEPMVENLLVVSIKQYVFIIERDKKNVDILKKKKKENSGNIYITYKSDRQ